jgi:hypothetical protein
MTLLEMNSSGTHRGISADFPDVEAVMRLWSSLAMPWDHKPESLCWPPAFTVAMIFAAIFGGCLRPAAAALTCGAHPENVPVNIAEQLKGDTEGKARAILQAPPNVDQRALTTTKRRELRQKYGTVEPTLLDQNLLWVACQTISNDPALAASQKFDEYAKVYRFLTEPMGKAAHPAE